MPPRARQKHNGPVKSVSFTTLDSVSVKGFNTANVFL